MKTIVAKFGGSSLADAAQFRKVRAIIESDPQRRFIVASAPGRRSANDVKVTDLLYECQALAARHADPTPVLDQITARFTEIIEDLGIEFDLQTEMAIIRSRLRERDYMASRGEYLNSKILAAYLGVPFYDAAESVRFLRNGRPDYELTNELLASALSNVDRAVVPGFYGADASGVIRTFSRGGSDVTGSLVARAVGADLYENWTDVSGLLAADPRIVEHPKSVEYMSYRELRTLSYMGASVLHTDAVLPAADMGIPINIRNTDEPENPGTMIVRKLPKGQKKYPVIGVAGRKGMSVIQVEKVMVSDGSGFSAIMLDILKNRQLPFEQCLTGIDSVTLVIRDDLLAGCKEDLLEEIRETLKPDFIGVRENLSMIAVVGEKGTESTDANVKVLQALTREGIEISTINQGAGKLNLLIGVPDERYEEAIRAIYGTI